MGYLATILDSGSFKARRARSAVAALSVFAAALRISSIVVQARAPNSPAIPEQPRLIQGAKRNGHVKSIRIGSWNIDRGQNLSEITEELRSLESDLLLLQEVDWNTLRSGKVDEAALLARDLHFEASYGVEFEELSQEDGSPAYIGQATLTSLPIRTSRVLRFRSQSDFWQPRSWIPSRLALMQRRQGGRMALVTELTFAGRPLIVYNAHLESRSYGRIQWQQVEEMLQDLAHKYPSGVACVIGGDLNTKYLPSIFLHRLQKAGFRSATGDSVERSHVIAMALDWIFVRGAIDLTGGRVDRNVKGSDHYPVIVSMRGH